MFDKIELMLYKNEGYVMRRTRIFSGYDYAIYDITRPPQYIKKFNPVCVGRDPHVLSHLLENKHNYKTLTL